MKTHRRHKWLPAALAVLKWSAIGVGILVALCVFALVGITIWLTPERLTRLVNEEASEYVNADVRVSNLRYKVWSTWPHLELEADSLYVRSRNFDSLPARARGALPAGADFLASAGRFRGGLDLRKLMIRHIDLRDVEVDSLCVNLVAVTDSLNNFDITRSSGRMEVPYFHIDGMRLTGAGKVRYTGVASASDAEVDLDTATLMPTRGRNSYALRLLGDVTVKSGGVTFLDRFPFGLGGDVSIHFRPFRVSASDYHVALGSVKGNMTVDVEMGDSVRIDKFSYKLEGVSLNDLLALAPWLDVPALKRLHADLDMDLSARLMSPYIFSSAWLPSVEVDFNVPDGRVSYSLDNGDSYGLNRATLSGRMFFDGRDPAASYVEIPRMSFRGMGAEIDAFARMTHLTTAPEIRATVNGRCDLQRLAQHIKELQALRPKGEVDLDAELAFRLSGGTMQGTSARVTAESRAASVDAGACRVEVERLRVMTGGSYADALTMQAAMSDVPVGVSLKAAKVRVASDDDSAWVEVRDASAEGGMGRRGDGSVTRSVRFDFKGREVKGKYGDMDIGLQSVGAGFHADRMKAVQRSPRYAAPQKWVRDSSNLAGVPHTPEYLGVSLPAALHRLMSEWRVSLEAEVGSAEMTTPGFNSSNRLRGFDIAASFDSVVLHRVELASGSSGGRVSGRVSNLRQFLEGRGPAPLRVSLDLDFDTIQINELARAYTSANPGSAIARDDKKGMEEGIDTIACLVPRNLEADIRFKARETRYINLKLYDLDGKMRLADGDASVDTLHIGSDFGEASVKLRYDTHDVESLGVRAGIDITQVDLVNFFKNFPSLTAMWPSFKNLSGDLSVSADTRLLIFPDMYINVPSIWADAEVHGRDLKLKQNSFIRRVTRMLMIPTSDPLHIHDIDIHAAVQTNLLEVFPFKLKVGSYDITLEGLNNFNGDLFYHIGVDKWPLKLPFGVNVKGSFSHPELRFGGKKWHDREGAKITAGVEDSNRINLLKMARRGMGEFVHTAAVYNE